MHFTIREFIDMIAAVTEKEVKLVSTPSQLINSEAIEVWIWRVDEDRSFQNIPAQAQENIPGLKISCLLFGPDVETLDAVRTAIFKSSILGRQSQTVSVYSEPLESNFLIQLFLAADIVPRICLSYLLQGTVK